MHQRHTLIFLLLLSLLLGFTQDVQSQLATIREETKTIKTYPFSDPDPVAILASNPKIYPYHQFLGYSLEGYDQDWKVVVLENEYIQVFVLPESGGKVWGAIEKSTGKEFIYRNEVMKFRNIAMRGPWTSGGIEFNFGIIGHAPTTATPVDYHIKEHEDGSVSCTVGAMDLTSRTQWRVQIILPPDKAYFKTQSTWYNPTPQHQAYYNWMTAAARASDDLEFFYPGDAYLGHPGDLYPWPMDAQGRELSFYRNNNFGGSKSYHVVGNYHNYFGGYWHDKNFGFGHWSRYDDMPGQKLWIWALSRSGGIWEDLLTDTDGQYIEFQAGRLLTQYSYSNQRNPITEVAFGPYVTDQWEELWFPIKELEGVSGVSVEGVISVEKESDVVTISFNAFGEINDTLVVTGNDNEVLHEQAVTMKPMDVFNATFSLPSANQPYQILFRQKGKVYQSNEYESKQLSRPFSDSSQIEMTDAQQLYYQGYQLFNNRNYEQAESKLRKALELAPAYQSARITLAELLYRNAEYQTALDEIYLALETNAYDAQANYVAANIFSALDQSTNALEAFGWAARSMEYRSAAYTQMGEIYLKSGDYQEAEHYSQRALDFNRYNVPALQNLAIIYRKTHQSEQAEKILAELLALDPLNHFARFERYLANPTPENLQKYQSQITNEFPVQSHLEIGIKYHHLNRPDDALAVLNQAPDHPLVEIWKAYLTQDNAGSSSEYLAQALALSPEFVFPYRPETLEVLKWAADQQNHWKLHYYLGLNLWALNQFDAAAYQFTAAGKQPEFAPFYLSRAELQKKIGNTNGQADMERAIDLGNEQWTIWHQYLQFLNRQTDAQKALQMAKVAREKFPDSYVIGMDYAQALFNAQEYQQCISVLNDLQILPYEGASEGRLIYEQAHLYLALRQIQENRYDDAINTITNSLEWPENLGVGKPYNPDITTQNYLLAYCHEQQGKGKLAQEQLQTIVATNAFQPDEISPQTLLVLSSLQNLGKDDELQEAIHKLTEMDSPTAQWILAVWQDQSIPEVQESNSLSRYRLIKEIHQTLALKP
jgi:tetratricopeptide (TPR) repeat protein